MHMRMGIYPRAAVERAMKLQEVLLRATGGEIKWWQAAEMIGTLRFDRERSSARRSVRER